MELMGFQPHGHCIQWSEPLLAILVISNAIVGIAYFIIPYVLYKVWKQSKASLKIAKEDLSIILWTIGFILLCGLTHLCNVFTMWVPAWYTQALLDSMTAVVSIYTALVAMPRFARRINSFPSIEEFNQMRKERDMLLQAVEDKKQLAIS